MEKDVIHIHGQDIVVNRGAAKAFQGVDWALMALTVFVVFITVLLIAFFLGALAGGAE